jgi:hypothetical protein
MHIIPTTVTIMTINKPYMSGAAAKTELENA